MKEIIRGLLNAFYFHKVGTIIFTVVIIVCLVCFIVSSIDKKTHKLNVDGSLVFASVLGILLLSFIISSFCIHKYDTETTNFTITKNLDINDIYKPFKITLLDGTTFYPDLVQMIGQPTWGIGGDYIDYQVLISDQDIFKYNLKDNKPDIEGDCLIYITEATAKKLGIIQ